MSPLRGFERKFYPHICYHHVTPPGLEDTLDQTPLAIFTSPLRDFERKFYQPVCYHHVTPARSGYNSADFRIT